MDIYSLLQQTAKIRVSDGDNTSIWTETANKPLLCLIWSQLGDFDNLEYAWWLQREAQKLQEQGIIIRAIGIGDRKSGQKFCEYTGFPADSLFVDPTAEIHRQLGLYPGLSLKLPLLNAKQNAWFNFLLMCAGIGSPGTLKEVFRGYKGDRNSPQLIADEESVRSYPLPAIKGEFFALAGGKGFQRPFELATLRLRNMSEVLGDWNSYVPDASYITQRGATFLFNPEGKLLYEHRDQGILGFAANMSNPLAFIDTASDESKNSQEPAQQD